MALLGTEGLGVRFGGNVVLSDLTISLPAQRLVGLIGPNGAGKTTLIDALTGFVPATGRVTFDGTEISTFPPHRRARLGLGRTWQSVELFPDLSVTENLEVGTRNHGLRDVLRDLLRPPVRSVAAAAHEALERLGVRELGSARPDELSYGERKLVGIARALMLDPSYLLLDEPGAGLDSAESVELGRRLRELADQGVGLLLVDHDMGLVLGSCHHVHVLQFGKLVAAGTPEEIRRNEQVVEAYLGRAESASIDADPAPGARS